MKTLIFRTPLPAVALLLLAACNTPHAQFPVQRYVPLERSMVPLGELHLSNTLMGFDALEGEMKLQYVGQMPEAAGKDLAGASVYRVKNWKPYSQQNEGRDAWCSEAPRFVAVNSETGAPSWSREILVSLLTLEDWTKFNLDENRPCAAGTYVRARGD